MKRKFYEIIVVVDTNDADYVTQISKISAQHLDKVKPLIKAIKNFRPYTTNKVDRSGRAFTWTHTHNFPLGDGEFYPREDLGEKTSREIYARFSDEVFGLFETLLPYGEHGFHSITSIEVTPYVKKKRLL